MAFQEKIKEIKKIIKKANTIFLVAHKNLDLDALGSCIGMYTLLINQQKECYIIIDEKDSEMGVKKVLHEIEGCYNIIESNEIETYLNKKNKKNLLIVLDTNKKDLLQNKDCLSYFEKRLIIDHHELGKTSIKDGIIVTDTKVSSTCEMIVRLSEEYNITFSPYVSTILLSGLVLDTNNFTLNTNEETFYIAYYLSAHGASTKKVQYLLKQDLEIYTEQQKLLVNIEIIDNKIAISKGSSYITYRKEELAKTADTLLFFNDIEVSFVIGKVGKDKVGISARSLENYDIEHIMSKIGGGGNQHNGAATIENKNISEIVEKLKKIIKQEEK